MNRIQRLLAATDLSAPARRAAECAAQVAADASTEVQRLADGLRQIDARAEASAADVLVSV